MRSEEFKAAVGKFPTGVTVVSTSYEGKLWAFTANSFTSVSLEPSLISFCLDKAATSFKIFKESPYFAISILSSDQADLSVHFASHLLNKFHSIKYKIGEYHLNIIISNNFHILAFALQRGHFGFLASHFIRQVWWNWV